MDRFLINYLSSGRAWVFVGSGPSNEMGYPSWQTLASSAFSDYRQERPDLPTNDIEKSLRNGDFPLAFELMSRNIGMSRLLQILQTKLHPTKPKDIYSSICRWPVSVYLTTNYDDEIQQSLSQVGESFIAYQNSEDHLAHLVPGLSGAIFKLHGDLRSEAGLILTRTQYDEITNGSSWQHWRTKMTSIFQMNPIVVAGHSLTDPNIRHVLEAAKAGAGVHQPVCWIAPDVPYDVTLQYLEQFRIRVISYDNRDGDHRNLRLLLQRLSEFVPRRTAIRVQTDLGRDVTSPSGGAPGFFVFNRLQDVADPEKTRVAVLLAAIQAAIPTIETMGEFTIVDALKAAGWPSGMSMPHQLDELIAQSAVQQGLIEASGTRFSLAPGAKKIAAESRLEFEHSRQRFLSTLDRRIRKDYPGDVDPTPEVIARDICAALVGYFKDSGLTLASLLFASASNRQRTVIPVSILECINLASTKYTDLLARQVFISESIAIFSDPSHADKDFLGRIAQGYFGFHALGAFGETAQERIGNTKETVWLLDSNVQIAALALGSRVGDAWRECLLRLKNSGVRFFTVEQVFDETFEHFHFAETIVKRAGVRSREVSAAATGEPPFRKSNLFLQGFTRWVASGKPLDWEEYLLDALGRSSVDVNVLRERLKTLGVEVVPIHDWPGFDSSDLVLREEIAGKIVALRMKKTQASSSTQADQLIEPMKKAIPEAESWIVVTQEHSGRYYMLSSKETPSKSFFVSDTSILNLLDADSKITWQPEAFLRFASTLWGVDRSISVDMAFETVLWSLAQSGFNLLEERSMEALLGGVIDQSQLKLSDMRKQYDETLRKKYGESIESVVSRLRPIDRPMAVIQLAFEMGQQEATRRGYAEAEARAEKKRADSAERSLKEVESFRRKLAGKQERGRAKAKKQKARAKSRRKK